nr:MAG TPA: tail protein [Caudoviricetes sp.]
MQVRERMLNALPEILDKSITDMLEAEIPDVELITQLIFDTRRLMLLPEATEDWIDRWEKSLKIKPKTTDIEERRRYLMTLISTKVKISSQTLEKITKSFTNINNIVSVQGSVVYIKFLGELPSSYLKRFTLYIRELIPAHLGIQFAVEAPMNSTIYVGAFSVQQNGSIIFK